MPTVCVHACCRPTYNDYGQFNNVSGTYYHASGSGAQVCAAESSVIFFLAKISATRLKNTLLTNIISLTHDTPGASAGVRWADADLPSRARHVFFVFVFLFVLTIPRPISKVSYPKKSEKKNNFDRP